MGIIALGAIAVLVVLGFGNHLWWLVAGALYLFLSRPSKSEEEGGAGTARPTTYQAYRARRDRQARWERRYRRERARRWI
ncbi:hypothetical protein DF268_19325 [Streptomyces sp. V2]|uniref:hypothetical protein n=1 Tax=Streptomyces TaxID=1883 RepID=UPI0006EB910D|nr:MULTISPECIES: hypothetical protein [Streptomyces]PWG11906.1 hypothetical protein DF268_19325 [Streptomyces sp. V2]QZZ27425.1 hypothetical protein A7X85_15110 [Streptomyces sp. ST1015]